MMDTKRIMFSQQTGFKGRNGYFKCNGFELTNFNNENIIYIEPITSKNVTGNCQLEIPLEDIEEFIAALKLLK